MDSFDSVSDNFDYIDCDDLVFVKFAIFCEISISLLYNCMQYGWWFEQE